MTFRTLAATVVLIFAAVGADAQQYTYKRFLVPIYVTNVPGANGSIWTSSFVVANRGGETVSIAPDTVADWALTAGFSSFVRLTPGKSPMPGVVVWLGSLNAEPDVTFTLRVQDVSRQGETWGTTLPVVPPQEFAPAISLHDVPRVAGFRTMLRVYALDLDAPRDVRVTVYDGHVRRAFNAQVVTLQPGRYFTEPAYAQLDLTAFVPPDPHPRSTADVRIESLDGTPIWAFISVTHNVSQHMTAILPQ